MAAPLHPARTPPVSTSLVEVEIVYGKSGAARALKQAVPDGATIRQVIEQSGILARYPEIDLAHNKVGIFSRKKALHHRVQAGDRVEIYQALKFDPKEARRRRAQKMAG